jgi:hypothetical protein
LQMTQPHIAALNWQTIFDAHILFFGDFHPSNILLSNCLLA